VENSKHEKPREIGDFTINENQQLQSFSFSLYNL